MSLNWDVGDAPPASPPAGPAPHRRRNRLLALGGLVLLLAAGGALLSWQRRARLATAERAVLAAAELEQQALAAKDPDLLTAILPERVSRLGQVRMVREAQLPVPGVTIVGDRGRPEAVRLHASRPFAALDRAEVDVRTVVSDSYTTGQLLRRRRFAQDADNLWRLDLDTTPANRSGKPTPWVGTVLTTTVTAADEALARDLHATLDEDLAAFCDAARAVGRVMAWNACSFQLLSDGLPVKLNRRTSAVDGVALYLPSPPGSLSPVDDAGRAVLRRAYLREMIARWLGRDRALVSETLLEIWLAPDPAPSEPADAHRDWAQLRTDLQSNPPDQTQGGHRRLVQNLRLLAADVMQIGDRQKLLGLMLAWPPASPALWLSEGLADDQLERAVLARWDHAPAALPSNLALLAECMGGEFGAGRPALFLPGAYEGRLLDRLACPAGSTAEAAVWRPGTGQLAVQCSDPGGLDERGSFVRILDVRADGSLAPPTMRDWSPDGDLLPTSLAWSPDGRRLSAIGRDGIFHLWQADDTFSESLVSTIPDGSYFEPPAWSADGSRASLTLKEFDGSNGTFLNHPMTFLFDAGRARRVAKLDLTADAWSPSGATLAAHGTWQDDGTLPLSLIDGRTGAELGHAAARLKDRLQLQDQQPLHLWVTLRSLGWSPDGRWVALLASGRSAPAEGTGNRPASALIAWRPDDGATRTVELPELIGEAAWAADGNRILAARQPLDEDAAAGPVIAWSWSPASGAVEASKLPPAVWSADGQWGASNVGGTLALWPAGADRPGWSSEIQGCYRASWQPVPGDGQPASASP